MSTLVTPILTQKIDIDQVLPIRARVNLEAMAKKRYSAFPKAPALQ